MQTFIYDGEIFNPQDVANLRNKVVKKLQGYHLENDDGVFDLTRAVDALNFNQCVHMLKMPNDVSCGKHTIEVCGISFLTGKNIEQKKEHKNVNESPKDDQCKNINEQNKNEMRAKAVALFNGISGSSCELENIRYGEVIREFATDAQCATIYGNGKKMNGSLTLDGCTINGQFFSRDLLLAKWPSNRWKVMLRYTKELLYCDGLKIDLEQFLRKVPSQIDLDKMLI